MPALLLYADPEHSAALRHEIPIPIGDPLDNELLRVPWPEATKADVKPLVSADGTVIGDLTSLGSQDVLSANA